MRIHYLQHVPFEDLANIEVWAKEKGFNITHTKMSGNESLPSLDEFDWLVIMGGPMSVNDEYIYKWLAQEKRFIERAIQDGKTVLGICLGAQLIANVLGAKVGKNEHKEIGWFDVKLTSDAKKSPIFKHLPDEFIAFHWHGETFDIPSSCKHIAMSDACENQAFEYDDGRVIGLQFHLESSEESVKKLLKFCEEDIIGGGQYVQTKDVILSNDKYKSINEIMRVLLDNMIKL